MAETDGKVLNEEVEDVTNTEETNEKESYLYVVLFYFLGTACFVPNSFYVTANEYWMYKFRDPSQPFNSSDNSEKTNLQRNFTAYSNVASNVGSIVFLFLTIIILRKIELQKRIIGSIFLMVVFFTLTLIFIFVDTDSCMPFGLSRTVFAFLLCLIIFLGQSGFFVIAVGISGLLSSCSGVLLISLYQLAVRFHPRCLAAQYAGQSVCGILAAVVQILSLLVATSVTGTACLYYAIATGTLVCILVAYIVTLTKSISFQNKLKKKPMKVQATGTLRSTFGLDRIKSVLKKLWILIIALIFSAATTQILHPGLTALIESSGRGTNVWSDTYFLPVCVYLCFYAFEFIGRETSNHIQWMKNKYIIFATSIVRMPLLPLILLCNLQPRNHLPVVFHDDAYFIVFIILLAFSGGYLQNVAIAVVPEYCAPEEKVIGMLLIVIIMILFVTIFSVIGGVFVNVI